MIHSKQSRVLGLAGENEERISENTKKKKEDISAYSQFSFFCELYFELSLGVRFIDKVDKRKSP